MANPETSHTLSAVSAQKTLEPKAKCGTRSSRKALPEL